MLKFIDDLADALFDLMKLFCYFLAGVLIVSAIMYGIIGIIHLITNLFF
ncbi:hypothetical protein [Planococcus shenhongbingii]|uniref:Uncharacterized protein n=1 Tax=Planococcus shenhongbingii TaxID=3058398 RepID=A0ABT8NGC5_9BACL|nr:hypothetical protein [Planococcus sp. N017]MDN7246932.1 hypothetical protein [Planococcus sp. N017]